MFIVKDNTAHMANLSIYVGSYINGVAEIHTQILKDDCFKDWYYAFPERFQNKTNGITPVSYTHLDVYKRQDRDCAFSDTCAYPDER